MRRLAYLLILISFSSYAKDTGRSLQFENSKVKVWNTTVYPSAEQILKLHRHDKDRVVVALNDGILEVTNDQGKKHLLALKKNHSYYLPKDIPNELHTDKNVGKNPVQVVVIELKS